MAEPQFCHEMNSYASGTPAIEAGRAYFHFGVHGTACVDTKTGEVLWKRLPFDPELPCNHHRGAASSVILYEKLLICTFDGFDVQYVVALDKATGKTVWKRDREIDYGSDNGDVKKAYSTPHVFTVDGHAQLVSPSAGATIAYDPANGNELWRIKTGGMNTSMRPILRTAWSTERPPPAACNCSPTSWAARATSRRRTSSGNKAKGRPNGACRSWSKTKSSWSATTAF
ncbi:MAG: PQQ-binding-like beta-propeller repeat protein [Pirellulales bacterium]